ncbi:MAG: hypothetical protein ABSA49_14885 [Rhizomicrobium sp.]
MHPSDESPRGARLAPEARLAPQEWLFLAALILGWAVFVVAHGKDMSWDFRNYHWYIPYAFLNGRMGLDVAVAHQATFYNPFLDIPFYLLATHAHSWFALGVLGAVQGSNVVPIYLIARAAVVSEYKRIIAAVAALLALTGSLTVSLAGATYYDNVMSVFVLMGLALIIVQRDLLRDGPLWRGMAISAFAGGLTGSAVGLKLPEAPFALGFAAALAILPGDWRHRCTRLLAGGLGGVVGVALFAAYWFVKMQHLTGNPLFPYFNEVFHSPLALTASYRDMRFIPTDLKHQLLFPLLFSVDWGVADDLPFQDIRVGLAYVLAILTLPLWFFARRNREPMIVLPAAAALFAFVVVSYIAWLRIFGIYRYILLLEMIAPLVIFVTVSLVPASVRARLVAIAVLLLGVLVTTRAGLLARAPLGDPYIQVTIPPIAHPDKTMLLMTGEAPMGYLAPSFPPQIPIVRIDGWMIRPEDGSKLTAETRKRVEAFKGDLYVIFIPYEAARDRDALAVYGLAIRGPDCRELVTNLGGLYRFCPVIRAPSSSP